MGGNIYFYFMKFEIIISKWANFYFFLQNLSLWHFSNAKDYNLFWEKKVGPFTDKEKRALETFKKIQLKYPFGKNIFRKYFFLSKNPWETLKKQLPRQGFLILKDIFNLWQKKFESLYKTELPLLKKWQTILKRRANNAQFNLKILHVLNNLYHTNIGKARVNVYLLLSTSSHTAGGANIGKNSISLQISQYPINRANHALGIIWHETIHILFQNKYFFPLLLKNFKKPKDFGLINEATTGGLFPLGILGKQFLNDKLANTLNDFLSSRTTRKIFQLLQRYINNKKPLDDSYILKLKKIFNFSKHQ